MAENKVTVIGIAGGTGCGKTTVVKRLVEAQSSGDDQAPARTGESPDSR